MPSRAQLCRQKARECEVMAEAASDHDSKLQLRGAAKQWLDLAEQMELLDRIKVT